jgi:hypothetical protein
VNRYCLERLRPAMRLALPLVLVAVALSACAVHPATAGAPAAATPPVGEEDCIFASIVQDWNDLDSSHLIIYGPGRFNPYLVELTFPSNDLAFNLALGVRDEDHNGRICGGGIDSVLIPGGHPSSLLIRSVRRITQEQAKQMIAAAHPKKKPKAAPATDKPTG